MTNKERCYKSIKLMIVTPSFAGGGAERIAVNLANHYAKQGLNVVLLAFNGTGPYKKQINKNIEMIDLGTRLRSSFLKIYKEVKKQQPTHILSVLRGGNIVLGLSLFFYKKTKLIFREANTLDEIKRKSKLEKWIEILKLRIAYKRADSVVANSFDTKQDLVAFNIKVESKVKVISNPVLPDDFKELANENCNHKWLKGRFKVVLNVARLHPQKNQKFLIRSFSKIIESEPNARLLLIGEGELRNELEQEIKNNNIQAFAEILPFQQNPWPYYARSAVFALTSEWEGFGNVLVEALACGTPVVSVNCPGGPKAILNEGRYGVLVEPDDKDGVVDAILGILNNTIRFEKSALEERGKEYSVENISKKYFEHMVKFSHEC